MQWIINIVKEMVARYLKGKIFLWSGAVVDIPVGWALCNGTQSTPDLQNKFIPGAGSTYNPDAEGGAISHKHAYELAGLWHAIPANGDLQAGDGYEKETPTHYFAGLTRDATAPPPYYALAYIMKL